MENSISTSNNAREGGGAIYNYGNNFTIRNSTFINNSANNGGAIYNYIGAYFTINSSVFMNNHASTSGGVIYNNAANYFTIENSTFTNNNASYYGGVIYNSGINMSVIGSNFTNNSASYGDGIYNAVTASMLVSGNTMTDNNASVSGNVIYNNGTIGALNLTYINNSTYYVKNGQIVPLVISLTDNVGNPITGQNVTFYINGTYIGSIEVIEGSAIWNYIVNLVNGGVLPVNGTYDGSGNYPTIVKKGELILQFDGGSSIIVPDGKVGDSITATGVAIDENGNAIANVNFTISVNGGDFPVLTDGNGRWNFTFIPTNVGNFTATISWVGDDSHEGFTNTTTYSIGKLGSGSSIIVPVGKFGDSITATGVAIDESGNVISNVNLTISVNGGDFPVLTDGNGRWNFTFIPISVGNFSATVSWVGDDSHEGFTNTTTYSVEKIISSGAINASNGRVGQTINITGTLIDEDGKPIVNAQITVIVDGRSYTLITDDNGRWNLPYNATHVGTITITVNYLGNETYTSYEATTRINIQANNQTNGTNQTNRTNQTNNTNETNKAINNTIVSAIMKPTGIPMTFILLVLLSVLGVLIKRKY